MNEPFQVDVASVAEGVRIMAVLAEYDGYHVANNIKPDYCNTGGIWMWRSDLDGDGNEGWDAWVDSEFGIEDPVEYLELIGIDIPCIC